MIRINLLPVRVSKKRELGKQWLVLFALVLAGAGLGNYFWWKDSADKVQILRARVAKYQKEIATLEKIIGEVKNIKEEKAEMERKLAVLKGLRDGRTGPVRMMDELSGLLPARVTLTAFDEKDGTVTLTGYGASHEEVATFLRQLKGARFFSAPVLKSARATGETKVDFVITCHVTYSA